VIEGAPRLPAWLLAAVRLSREERLPPTTSFGESPGVQYPKIGSPHLPLCRCGPGLAPRRWKPAAAAPATPALWPSASRAWAVKQLGKTARTTGPDRTARPVSGWPAGRNRPSGRILFSLISLVLLISRIFPT
jgi:hypothetical protein